MPIKYLVIIFSLISLISCDRGVDITNSPEVNYVYLQFKNNTTGDINYQLVVHRCNRKLSDNVTEFVGLPECDELDNAIPSIVTTLQSATSYAQTGRATRDSGKYKPASFDSFIVTVTIGNVSKKIVGFNEELYRELFYDKPPEFFNDVISYGTFFGATLYGVVPTDFDYNPCWIGGHTELTEYAKFSPNAKYYLNIAVNSINDIKITLDKAKSRIGDSGYDKATNTCKFYVDEDVIYSVDGQRSLFPFNQEAYDNIPKDLTGRIYLITKPNSPILTGYGSDPQ